MSATTHLMKDLLQKKNDLETKIKEATVILESKGVGINGPLVDAEDFPRADVDVYSVRHIRHHIACLQNDHVEVMSAIEAELYRIHAAARQGYIGEESMDTDPPQEYQNRRPFAKIDCVDPGSPAHISGLCVGDQFISFGSICTSNFDNNLQTIAALVRNSIGVALKVIVLRNGREVAVNIVPQKWNGRGLLGCNILPMKNPRKREK